MPIVSGGGGAFNGGTITQPLTIRSGNAVGLTLVTNAGNDALEVLDELSNLWHYLDTSGGAEIGGGDATHGLTVGGSTGRVRVQPASGADALRVKDVNGLTLLEATTAALAAPVGIKSGQQASAALPTVQLVSGTGAQIAVGSDRETHTPVTFNPGVATTATVTVALSPDNVTYSTLAVVTKPVGTVFDGEIDDVAVRVPAGWYLKLTVNAQAALGLTTYY